MGVGDDVDYRRTVGARSVAPRAPPRFRSARSTVRGLSVRSGRHRSPRRRAGRRPRAGDLRRPNVRCARWPRPHWSGLGCPGRTAGSGRLRSAPKPPGACGVERAGATVRAAPPGRRPTRVRLRAMAPYEAWERLVAVVLPARPSAGIPLSRSRLGGAGAPSLHRRVLRRRLCFGATGDRAVRDTESLQRCRGAGELGLLAGLLANRLRSPPRRRLAVADLPAGGHDLRARPSRWWRGTESPWTSRESGRGVTWMARAVAAARGSTRE